MSCLKRALTSLRRRPGKALLLLLLIFLLGAVISGAISVYGAVNNTHQDLRRSLRPFVTFGEDWGAWNQYIEENSLDWRIMPDRLTASNVREIAALPYVDYFEYSIGATLSSWELIEYRFGMVSGNEVPVISDSERANFSVRGSSETELLQIREEVLSLAEGRTFTSTELEAISDVHPVMVSSGFAEINQLVLGDTFSIPVTIYLPHPDGDGIWDDEWLQSEESTFMEEVFYFEVIGLLGPAMELDLSDDSDEAWIERQRVEIGLRTLHVPNVTAEAINLFVGEGYREMHEYLDEEIGSWVEIMSASEQAVTSVMLLGDAEDLDAFHEAALALLPDFWKIIDMTNGFSPVSSAMVSLLDIADWVLWGAIVATLIILSLLITLFLRDRRNEMGVYLALGEQKKRIISQILVETVLTAIVGMTLALVVGNVISGTMSQGMIRTMLADGRSGFSTPSELDHLGFGQVRELSEVLEAFDTSLNLEVITFFYIVGIGIVILSTILPVFYVLNLDPKKILIEQ